MKPSLAARLLPWSLVLYCATSLLHFTHNAEYLADYPNLPAWLSRSWVYIAWCLIAAVGAGGFLLYRSGRLVAGLTLLAIYAALGLDGLLHYGRAPLAAHSTMMNATILTEVAAAAIVLLVVLRLGIQSMTRRI